MAGKVLSSKLTEDEVTQLKGTYVSLLEAVVGDENFPFRKQNLEHCQHMLDLLENYVPVSDRPTGRELTVTLALSYQQTLNLLNILQLSGNTPWRAEGEELLKVVEATRADQVLLKCLRERLECVVEMDNPAYGVRWYHLADPARKYEVTLALDNAGDHQGRGTHVQLVPPSWSEDKAVGPVLGLRDGSWHFSDEHLHADIDSLVAELRRLEVFAVYDTAAGDLVDLETWVRRQK